MFKISINRKIVGRTVSAFAFSAAAYGIYQGYSKLPHTTDKSRFQILVEKTGNNIKENQFILSSVGAGVAILISLATFALRYQTSNNPTNSQLARRLFKKLYKPELTNKSIRTDDVQWIRDHLSRQMLPGEQKFSVVIGPRGVGKTTAVETAADGLPGVILIKDVTPGTTKHLIIDGVWTELNGKRGETVDRGRQIIKKYKAISGGQSPIVIISADQRLFNKEPAELTATGRTLTSEGFNVLIDASENALPNVLSGREQVLKMEPMSSDTMCLLPDFKYLFDKEFTDESYKQVVLAVCGGRPLLLNDLVSIIQDLQITEPDKLAQAKQKAIREFTDSQIIIAFLNISKLVNDYPKMEKVCKRQKFMNIY
jgi:hypothetical protein